MKVVVKEFLNVRVGQPSVNAPTFQFLAPGSELEIDGKLYVGDKVEGVDAWVKDGAGNFYWSGGIHDTQLGLVRENVLFSNLKFNYNEILNIPAHFKDTKGHGIVVAIIDTGCHLHPALGDSVIATFNVFTKETNQRDRSLDSHGTFLAGMIAAREARDNQIIGVAPLVKLIIVKAAEQSEIFSDHVLAGLQWLSGFNIRPDIINLSMDFNVKANQKADFDKIFKSFRDDKTIIVAAGQNGPVIYSTKIFYPASDPQVVGVGCISKSQVTNALLNSQIHFVVKDFNFFSTKNFANTFTSLSGCSMSAAYVSGALSLILSWQKSNRDKQDPMALLNSALQQLTIDAIDDTLKLFKK